MTNARVRLRLATFAFVFVFVWSLNGFASQVFLKNGDRITGSATASRDSSLTMHSPLIGDVEIPWDAVDRAVILENVFVPPGLRKPVKTRGPSASEPKTKPAQPPGSPLTGTAQRFDLLRQWSGSIDPGFTLTGGNSNSRTLNIAVNAARSVGGQKVQFAINWLHTNSLASGRTFTTAKALRSATRYDYNVKENIFVFGSGNWEYDRFQQLDLRNVMGAGLGWHVLKRKTLSVDFLYGGNFNRESFHTGMQRNYLEAVTDEEINYRPNDHMAIRMHLALIPNLTLPGSYRAAFDATTVTSLTKHLGWQITLSDRYTSLHLPGVKPNDFVMTTGFRLAFPK